VDPLDVGVGKSALADPEALIVSLGKQALAPPVALDARAGLHRHRGTHVPTEMRGRPKGSLEAGAGYLQEVPSAGDGVVLVEGGTDAMGGPRQGIEVDPALPVDEDDNPIADVFNVEQLEAVFHEKGLDKDTDTVDHAHHRLLSSDLGNVHQHGKAWATAHATPTAAHRSAGEYSAASPVQEGREKDRRVPRPGVICTSTKSGGPGYKE
jgi:ribosomal protein L12E/L44/L45/RPP1/RPP2